MNEYHQQADAFLAAHGITFRAVLSNTKTPNWESKGHCNHYKITLAGKGRKVTFDFFDSINNTEKGGNLVAYVVLSCISGDVNCPETFEDFCGEFGFDADSIKALKTFKDCNALAKKLRKFFTENEIEELQEIR